jgi:hypothetical protein
MLTDFWEKIKESAISVAPIMLLVLILNFTLAPLPEGQLGQFLFGGLLIILGLSIFLVGADIGMVPFGQKVGSALTHRRNLPLILIVSFAIGFAVTIAEPDVQVLATQVTRLMPDMDRGLLLFMIAVGVGIFLLVGTGRIVVQVSLRSLLIIFYILLFGLCAFVDPVFVGVAFDAGGATTGPVTVPFIMAMGIGVASAAQKKKDDDSSFGLVGLASIGPISAVALMGFLFTGDITSEESAFAKLEPVSLLEHFPALFPEVSEEIALALLPLLLIFFIFQFTLLRLPIGQVRRIVTGFIYCFIGLTTFLVGVIGGFSPVGQSLGMAVGPLLNGWILLPLGLVVGAVVVCAEPAVWILTRQIEEISGGHIQRHVMLMALSISIALAVLLGMLRVVTGISIWYVVLPGYVLALVLTKFCPALFTAIAFDSGGVASGPMATTFVLSLTLGASHAVGGNPATDAFGMIAMIAMAPLITIQFLGLIFKFLGSKKGTPTKENLEPAIHGNMR